MPSKSEYQLASLSDQQSLQESLCVEESRTVESCAYGKAVQKPGLLSRPTPTAQRPPPNALPHKELHPKPLPALIDQKIVRLLADAECLQSQKQVFARLLRETAPDEPSGSRNGEAQNAVLDR
jgi:hypothetical protein